MSERRSLEIGIDIDNSSSITAADKQMEMFKRIEAAADRMAKAIEGSSKAANDRQVASAKAAADRREQIEKSSIERQEQAASAKEARDQQRAEKKQKRIEAQAKREVDAEIAAWATQADKARENELSENKRFSSSLASNLASAFGVTAGIGASIGFAKSYVAALKEGKQEAMDLAKFTGDIRDKIKDIVALRGGSGAKTTDLAAFADLRVSSGLKADAAHDYAIDYESSIATATDENMSQKEKDKLKTEGAIFANRTTRGDAAGASSTAAMLGTLARFQKGGTASKTIAIGDKLNKIMSLGDGSNDEQRAQLNKVLTFLVSPDGTGLAKNPQEAVALTAMMSTTGSVSEAATGVEQSMRALRGFQKRLTHGGFGKSQAEYLKKDLGITEKDDAFSMIRKFVPDIAKAEASGRAPDAYLKQFFHGDEEVNALVRIYRAHKQGAAGKILGEAQTPIDEADSQAKQRGFLSSKEGRKGIAEARLDRGKMRLGEQTEEAVIQKTEAEADLYEQGKLGTTGAAAEQWRKGWGNKEYGKNAMINQRITERARLQGVDIQSERGGWTGLESFDPLGLNEANDMASGQRELDVASAYDNAYAFGKVKKTDGRSNAADMSPVVRELEKVNNNLGRLQGGPITQPVPGGGRPSRPN
jgi:hypothetical protein